MNADPEQMHDTILRVRRMHGVYDKALMIAAEALVEAHPTAGLVARDWHERLLMRATQELTDDGVLPAGRWALFSNDDLLQLREAAGAVANPVAHGLTVELDAAVAGRGIVAVAPVPSSDDVTVAE